MKNRMGKGMRRLLWLGWLVGCGGNGHQPQVNYVAGALVADSQVRLAVLVRNESDVAVEYAVAFPCGVFLRVYQHARRDQPPAWDGARWEHAKSNHCRGLPSRRMLEPGEVDTARTSVPIARVLGDSLPPGSYDLSALLNQYEPVREWVDVPAGRHVLGKH